MRAAKTAFLVLSLSPAVLVVSWVAGVFVLRSPWAPLCGAAVVFGPLLFLVASRQIQWNDGVRPLIWAAACSGLLLIPGIALALAPHWLHATDPGLPAIQLQPDPNSPGRYQVTGLNVRWPPTIQKLPAGAGATFAVEMSQNGGASGEHVPANIEDGFGNRIDFSEPKPGILHLQDNAGGFADVDWTAPAPILVRSQAVPRNAAARGPLPFARRAVAVGQTLLFTTPFLGLMLFTLALLRQDRTAALVRGSFLLQTLGVALQGVLLLFVWTSSGQGGEAGIGMALLAVIALIPAAGTSLTGAGLLSLALRGMLGSLE
jgi:hypothetical protein